MQNGFPLLSEGQGRCCQGVVGAASSGKGSPGHLTFKITAQWHTTRNIEKSVPRILRAHASLLFSSSPF